MEVCHYASCEGRFHIPFRPKFRLWQLHLRRTGPFLLVRDWQSRLEITKSVFI
jgi:hypothetical protein